MPKMKAIYLLITLLIISVGSYAQSDVQEELDAEQETTGFDKSKLYYGGYMSLSFGSYNVIGIAPLVGYKFTPKFSGGVQLSYEYSSYDYNNVSYSASNYGGSVFARYRIVPKIYAHAEYSTINYEIDQDRKWVPFLFLGGGFSQPISKNTWLTAQVLFDVINSENSPYSPGEPFFSIGVGIGF